MYTVKRVAFINLNILKLFMTLLIYNPRLTVYSFVLGRNWNFSTSMFRKSCVFYSNIFTTEFSWTNYDFLIEMETQNETKIPTICFREKSMNMGTAARSTRWNLPKFNPIRGIEPKILFQYFFSFRLTNLADSCPINSTKFSIFSVTL